LKYLRGLVGENKRLDVPMGWGWSLLQKVTKQGGAATRFDENLSETSGPLLKSATHIRIRVSCLGGFVTCMWGKTSRTPVVLRTDGWEEDDSIFIRGIFGGYIDIYLNLSSSLFFRLFPLGAPP
jgi:hypothetical protein